MFKNKFILVLIILILLVFIGFIFFKLNNLYIYNEYTLNKQLYKYSNNKYPYRGMYCEDNDQESGISLLNDYLATWDGVPFARYKVDNNNIIVTSICEEKIGYNNNYIIPFIHVIKCNKVDNITIRFKKKDNDLVIFNENDISNAESYFNNNSFDCNKFINK